VTRKHLSAGAALLPLALALAALLLAGCSTLNNLTGAMGGGSTQNATQPKQPDNQAAPDQGQTQAQAPAGSAMVYQYQFGAFYTGFWSMGWFGYKDANYAPGQGTIWKFANAGKSKEPVTFERALLKVVAGNSQWWRFKMTSSKSTIVYEFLVGPDAVVTKVRYQDPGSGAIGEFVPSQDQMNQPGMGASTAPKTRAEMAKYLVGRESVQVAAGSFMADHYLYTDDKSSGTAESWVNEKVPGYMVKSIYTNKKNNQTATGELTQIESGVTTSLNSY
jgi:hypothetical protein